MPDNVIELSFRRLLHLLHSSELDAEQREARIAEEVQAILAAVPEQPEFDQQDIRAALYALGLLPDRRTGEDRREVAGKPRQAIVFESERRCRQDRRQQRDVQRWIGTWT